ncbi:MAG: SDR family NAD(P)-dependent oxidoreductase [Oscillospiraceae bacterium]|nr:SDR family NAD(P)-dependent oxidoreductase [Oscillospiraceae bacterium]
MKTAIITGASSGLGKEFVRQIHDVFPQIEEYWLIARREDHLQALSVPGVVLRVLPLDLTSDAYLSRLQEELSAQKPDVQLLINCAGCGYLGNFHESALQEQCRMLDLNIRALSCVTHAVLPFMAEGGRILNISSIASFVPNVRMTVYSATKAYVSFFSRGLHEELKPRRISVTAVCPGPMDTEFIQTGRIKGYSKTFDTLPYCIPHKVVRGALKAAKKRRAVYTPKFFYKLYRVLSGLIPHAILLHLAKT